MVALADERFDETDHWTFTQVVGAGFERKTEDADLAVSRFLDHAEAMVKMRVVARQ